MSAYATIFALATAYALAGAALRHAWQTRRQAQQARRDYDLRVAAALRTLNEFQDANTRLQIAVQQREQAIAGLLDRLNTVAVANVAARRAPILELPVHRVDLHHFSPN